MMGSGYTRREVLASAVALASTTLVRPPTRLAEAGSPRLGSQQPAVYRFQLGEFEVTTISDAAAMIDGPWPIVGEDRPAAEVETLMQQSLLPAKRFQPGFTPMLVNTGRELVLFDTGNGSAGFVPRPEGGRLASLLRPAGFTPDQVDVVVLSHLHPDHVGGSLENGKPLFPRARYVIGSVEHNFWRSKDRLAATPGSNEHKTALLFQTHVLPFASRTTFVDPGSDIAPGIRAVEAYGHTPGHLGFHLESQGQRLLFWGDCAHHEVASLAHPEWHAFFDMDKSGGAATRKRIYDMAATERIAIAGYHTSFPSIGFIQREGSAYRWLPATYQFRP